MSRLSACVLLAICAAVSGAQMAGKTLRAADFAGLDEIQSACAAACTVVIDGPVTWTLGGERHAPVGLHLRFTPTGALTLSSGTLVFDGGSIEAPATRIFVGEGAIRGLAVSRPEWFVRPFDGVVPSDGARLAYLATVPYGTILLGRMRYVSPFSAMERPGKLRYDSPRTLIGAGRPRLDSETEATKLEGGTILLGEWAGTAALRAVHLGFDNGPVVAHDFFGGYQGYGIRLESTGHLDTVRGTRLEDVAVLTGKVFNQHSVIIEGQSDVAIDGLSIWTLGGTRGLVIKSYNVDVRNFQCKGASDDCLIVKSDYATDRAGYSAHVHFENVRISYLKQPGDTGGIVLDARWDGVQDVSFHGLEMDGLTYGFVTGGSWFHTLRDVRVDGWRTKDMRGPCFSTSHSSGIVITNSECGEGPGVKLSPSRDSLQMVVKMHLRVLYTMVVTRLHAASRTTLGLVGGTVLLLCTVFGWRRMRSLD